MPSRKPRKCDRCGKKIAYPNWVHSHPTNKYYCTDLNACAARAKKRNRKEVQA